MRELGPGRARALDVVGGSCPLNTAEFALRSYLYTMNTLRNPLKEVMDAYGDVRKTPPMLGIFSDIPWHQIRESEVHAWARAGFTWVVCDGEHSQNEGRYGREQLAMMLRLGITPIQRLHREARSEHGDALTLGARGTMAPYGTTVDEAQVYFKSVKYPEVGAATPDDRGGFPLRLGDRELLYSPDSLKAAETETQGWIQFETNEYILDKTIRDQVLTIMEEQGPNKAAGFVGPFDAVMRNGPSEELESAIDDLFSVAADRGLFMGRICGSAAVSEPHQIEDSMVRAIESGCRLISVHWLSSDLPYLGAKTVAAPFWKAVARCGF